MARQRDIIDIEMWRDVPDFEDEYQVSSHGRVRRFPRIVPSKNGSFAMKSYMFLAGKDPKHTKGYKEVALIATNGRQRRRGVHWLVCRTFHGPQPTAAHQAAHFDGNRTNNRADNLRWATPLENAADRVRHGTSAMGERNWKTTLTEADVAAIRANYKPGYGGYSLFVEQYGLTRGAVYRIVKRKNWKHI